VRKWDATNGFLHTITGAWLHNGHSGDGGPATNAHLNFPHRVAVDVSENVFVLEQGPPSYVRRIDGVTGIITSIAGGGAGDGASGPATTADLGNAAGLAVDNLGGLYLGGLSNVWRVDLASGNIAIIAGGGTTGVAGDGGPATSALINFASSLTVAGAGDVYLTDSGNDRVRKITPDNAPPFQVLVDLTVSQSCLPVQTQVRSNLYLATVNGRLSLVLPNGTNVPGDVIVTNSTSLSAITVPAPAKVGGNLIISGTNSATWDLSQLTKVGGGLSVVANGNGNVSLGSPAVTGGLMVIANGSGDISLGSPSVNSLDVTVNGSGNFDLGNPIVTKNLTVSANGNGNVDLGNPSVSGDMTVTNGGMVTFQSPTVKSNMTSSVGDSTTLNVGASTVGGNLKGNGGSNSIVIVGPASVTNNLDIGTGNGSTVNVGNPTVGGAVTLGTGSGSTVDVGNPSVAGGLTIGAGSGSTVDVGHPNVSGDLAIGAGSGSTVVVGNPTVGSDLTIGAGSGSTVDVGNPIVGGDMTATIGGASGTVDFSGAQVSGDTTLVVGDATTVSASTAGGNTSVTLSNGPALMQVVLPAGTFTSNVVFSVETVAPESVTTVSVTPVAAYRFAFAIPTLNQDASLTFDIQPAALEAATRTAFLSALAIGNATMGVLGDAPGSTWQTFPICGPGQSPSAGGCVNVTKLDATGVPLPDGSLDEPTTVRFSGVAGHFSTWGVVLAQAGPPPVHLQTSLPGNGGLRLSWTGPTSGVLETSTNLAPNSWSPAGSPTQQPDGSWRFDAAPTEPARFYRFKL